VDARPVTATDVLQRYTGFEPAGTLVALAPGHHTIEYVAPPFATLRCRLSVPRASADTCPLARSVGAAAPRVRALDLGGTPQRLGAAARAELDAAVAEAIAGATSTTSIASGERVRMADGSAQEATGPLDATLSYALATDQLDGNGASPSCGSLCRVADDAYIAAAVGQPLPLVAAVALHWHYSLVDGELPFDGAADASGQSMPGLLQLDLRWDGAWHVTRTPQAIGSAPCSVAQAQLAAASPSLVTTGTFGLIPAARDADGCLIRWWSCADPAAPCASSMPGTATVSPASLVRATFVYRFGLLFAADASARALVPDLPAPDSVERSTIARIWDAAA
jgi:hypothetical protein